MTPPIHASSAPCARLATSSFRLSRSATHLAPPPDREREGPPMMRLMPSLRLRLIGLLVALALSVAAVMIFAVERFSADQIMTLAKQGGASPEEAQAMFDAYVARVLVVGAIVGVALGAFAAWWLLRRILRPLDRLAQEPRSEEHTSELQSHSDLVC